MTSIRVTNEEWGRAGVYYVRTEAMTLGFNCALPGEFGSDDRDSKYILVVDDDGKPLSTARVVFEDEKGYAKIERVATVSYARGIGAGRLAIEAAEDWIREHGLKKIIITSRDEAVGFYEKLGYKADYSIDCHALFPNPPKKEEPLPIPTPKEHPRFTVVYTEKTLD